jgi:hypothetical protein
MLSDCKRGKLGKDCYDKSKKILTGGLSYESKGSEEFNSRKIKE